MTKTFASLFIVLAFIGDTFAGIGGRTDRREVIGWIGNQPDYLDDLESVKYIWNTSPYSSIVQVRSGSTRGTGEFISPRHVLTNEHVAQGCGTNGKADCTIYTSNNQVLNAHEVFFGTNFWVILRSRKRPERVNRSKQQVETPAMPAAPTEIAGQATTADGD